MRPIEILLSGANLLAFLSLVLPLPAALRYAAPLTLGVALVHGVTEGPRWQMIPAYAMTGVFGLIWLIEIVVPGGCRVSQGVAGLGIALSAVGLLAAIVLPIVLPVFHFPTPTGPYAIGTTTYHWVDTNRPEDLHGGPSRSTRTHGPGVVPRRARHVTALRPLY